MSTFWYPPNKGWGNAATVAKQKKQAAIKARNAAAGVTGYDPYESAMKSTDQILAEMLAEVSRSKEAARAKAEQEAQLELDKGKALAYGIQQLGIPANIAAIFQNAAGNQANLAQGFSGNIRDEAAAQAAQQVQALVGTGQEGAVRNQGDNMGNVAYGLGGFIPGNELSTLGAAFGAQAALEPGFALQFGAINEAKRRQEWADELRKFGDQEADVLGKKPELVAKAYNDELDRLATARKLRQDQEELLYKRQKDTADRQLKLEKFKLDRVTAKDRSAQGWTRLEQQADATARANEQAWARIGISSQNAQTSISRNELAWKKYKTGSASSGITKAQAQKFRRDAGAIASKAWNGVPVTQTDENGDKVSGMQHLSYQEAMREGLARGIPLSVMQTSLNAFWKKPGYDMDFSTGKWVKKGTGRPVTPFQLRTPKGGAENTSNPIVQDALNLGPKSGLRYVFGGAGNGGFDCSGFTKTLLERRGVTGVPHNAAAQFNDPRGKPVDKKNLAPGDVVFFKSSPNSGSSQPPWHCGYYIGNGKFVEYYSTGKPARVSSVNSRKDWMGARRFA